MKNLIIRRLQRAMLLVAILFPLSSADADSFVSNDAKLDYEVQGTGAAVFILHGGLTSREDLRLLIEHLAKNYQVVALDSREHGKSSNSTLQISYELMASDVQNLAAHLGLTDITVIGQSDGGITALTTALTKPALVARLILIGASFSHVIIPKASKEYLISTQWPIEMDRTNFPGKFLDDYLKGGRKMQDYQPWFGKLARMWTTSPNYTTEELGTVKAPTLVVNGDHEDVPLAHTTALFEALPNAQLFIVPGASHFLHTEKPELLHQAISRFLAE